MTSLINPRPLVIIDASCVVHLLVDFTRDPITKKVVNQLNNRDRDKRLLDGIELYNTLFFLHGINPSDCDIIWTLDNKDEPYWRVGAVKMWLESLPPEDSKLVRRKGTRLGYKANRDSCSYRQWVMKRMGKFCQGLGVGSFESDDVAAAIVKIYPGRKVILLTIDSDWLQMVNEDVTWVCLKGYSPQVRDLSNAKLWFQNKLNKESVKTRELINSDDVRNIVDWKMLCGDISDNLPAGTPREIIDLYNPPDEHKLWLQPWFKKQVEKHTKSGVKDNGETYIKFCQQHFFPHTPDCTVKL